MNWPLTPAMLQISVLILQTLNPKTNSSAYLTIATACRAIIQSASSSLAALARQEFTKMKIAL